MSLSKRNWLIITLFCFVLLLIFSVYRYQHINAPFKEYRVLEIEENVDEKFMNEGFSYIFGEPLIKEKEEHIYYEVPLQIKNNTKNEQMLPFDRLYIRSNAINNRINMSAFRGHPGNLNLKNEYLLPNQEVEIILTFHMPKMYGAQIDAPTSLYIVGVEDKGVKILKHVLTIL